jgi:hypothetical protein
MEDKMQEVNPKEYIEIKLYLDVVNISEQRLKAIDELQN